MYKQVIAEDITFFNTHSTSASHEAISDLEADDPEQYEGRQEGVQHKKVQGVA